MSNTRVENIRTNIYINDKTAGQNLRQLTNQSRKLRNEIALLTPGTDAFIKKTKELQQVNARLRDVRGQINGVSRSWSSVANSFNKYAAMVTAAGAALAGFALSALNVIKRNADLSDSMADVMKTTGLTNKEVQQLYSDLGKINTRTSRAELLALAEEAGRLGINGQKNILEFVKVANQLKVALGDDLGGDEAIREVGKLTEQFRVAEREGVGFEEAMLKIGSALNEVSAAGSAQARWQVDFLKRMAPTAENANITAANILGIGAALDEAGQTAETSGTALSKFIMDMYTDTATYAEIANVNLGEFSKLLQQDANAALLKVMEGLKGNNEGFTTLANKLDGLGLDGARAIGVITSLANNLEKVTQKQTLANTAMQEGTSLTNEYNIKNENLAAGWERLQRAIAGAFINSQLTNALKDIVFWLNKMIEVPVSQTMEEERIRMRSLELQIYHTNISHQERVKLINQLKEISPGHLSNINAETVSNNELRKSIAKVNAERINEILLKKEDEDIEEQNQKTAEYQADLLSREEQVRQRLVKLIEEQQKKGNQIDLPEGQSTLDQALSALKQLQDFQKNERFQLGGRLFNDVANFEVMINNLAAAEQLYNGQVDIGNRMQQKRNELAEKLGIILEENNNQTNNNDDNNTGPKAGDIKEEDGWLWRYDGTKWVKTLNLGNQEVNDKAAKAVKDAEEKIQEFLKAAQDARLINSLEGQEKELAQIQVKYDKMIELAKKHSIDLKAIEEQRALDIAAINARYEEDRLDKLEAQAQLSLDEQTANNKLAQELKLDSNELMLEYYRSDYENYQDFEKAKRKELEETARLEEEKKKQMEAAARKMASDLQIAAEEFPALAGAAKIAASAITLVDTYKGAQLSYNSLAWIPGVGPALGAAAAAAAVVAGLARVKKINEVQSGSYAEGGYTGLGFGTPDESGFKQAGIVHEGEYVIPKWMMQDQQVANITAMLENIRTSQGSFAGGGGVNTVVNNQSSSSTTVLNQQNVELLLGAILEKLDRPAVAVFNDKVVRDINERINRDNVINNRSKLN